MQGIDKKRLTPKFFSTIPWRMAGVGGPALLPSESLTVIAPVLHFRFAPSPFSPHQSGFAL